MGPTKPAAGVMAPSPAIVPDIMESELGFP